MPSTSKKQHNLMEAVAHNPGFAKKVGIPQSVGKHFHEADKMKRKKHYDDGGDVDVGSISGPDLSDVQMPDVDLRTKRQRFNAAYATAKPGTVFDFEGAKYSKPAPIARPSMGNLGSFTSTASRLPRSDMSQEYQSQMRDPSLANPSGVRPYVNPEEYSQQARNEGTLRRMGILAAMAPVALEGAGALGAEEGGGYLGSEGMAALNALKRRGQLARNLRKVQAPKEAAAGKWTDEYGLGLKKGGKVKHANELKGKAKETKSIAAAEMKALKRGHAPKDVMEHEKAEHKAMGYKHGGHIGGRKPPHSSKGEEGDTKLKGFGMGKGTGHGRKVTKAATPKDEMPRKGFAMKKGGHVKRMKGGGMGAPKPRRPRSGGVNPAVLAAMMGPPGQAAGAPPGPMSAGPGAMPGMKKGGHVSHHHHHHYAKGGAIETPFKKPETEKIIRGPRHGSGPHGDEGAKRGHTKGKIVKMAHGGHVGAHPSRRGDGAAHKGHTRCKVV